MDGMQMMMKALGVDPAAIMQAAGTFQAGLQKVMEDLATIKAQQEQILLVLQNNKIPYTFPVPTITCETTSGSAQSSVTHLVQNNG